MVRKGSVKDANAAYVQKLRIISVATDEEIQKALHKLFDSSPQGKHSQGPQDHSIFSSQSPQGTILPKNEESGPQGTEMRPKIIAATAVSQIQLDNTFKNSLHSYLQHEIPYSEIIKEIMGGAKQVVKNNLILKRMNGLLFVHDQNQDVDTDFWRIVVLITNK